MNYHIYQPSNCLSDFVRYYWQLELNSNSPTVQTNRVIPASELQMIFHYKTPFREVDKRDRHLIQPRSLICGQQTEYKDIVSSDSIGMLAVVFYPYALRAFLPNLVSEFTDRSISLNDLFPAETNILEERIIEANSVRSRILLIENFLLKRLTILNSFSITKEAVNIITKVNGQITVGEMANKLNLSKRQLERIFLADVGISPKKLGRIIRFNTSIKLFSLVEPLTALAYEAGYFDQSHLVRDFREFSGLSPKEFFRQPCHTREYGITHLG